MKNLFALLLLTFILTSCEKWPDFLVPDSDVPKWLKERIADDVKTIESNPQSGLNFAAWIRYSYNDKYFYEYVNLISSAGPKTYNSDGTEFMYTENNYTDYQSNKYCLTYIWQGPSYIDIYD